MNEELQKAISDLITGVLETTKEAGGFLAGELPEYITQLLYWHGLYSFLFTLLGTLILIVFVTLDIKVGKWVWKEDRKHGEIFWMGYVMLGNVPRVVYFLTATGCMSVTWLQIWLAPKVWLVEYASTLIGGK